MQTISFAFLLHIQGMSKVQPGNQELSFLISRWQYSRWHLDLSAKVISCHFFCSRIFPLSTLSLPSVLLLSWLRRQPPLKGTAVSSTALWCGQGQLLCPSAQQLTDLESFVNFPVSCRTFSCPACNWTISDKVVLLAQHQVQQLKPAQIIRTHKVRHHPWHTVTTTGSSSINLQSFLVLAVCLLPCTTVWWSLPSSRRSDLGGVRCCLGVVRLGLGRLWTCFVLFLWRWRCGRFPEEELMQECVDSLRTLHHDHVTTVLQDLQEAH